MYVRHICEFYKNNYVYTELKYYRPYFKLFIYCGFKPSVLFILVTRDIDLVFSAVKHMNQKVSHHKSYTICKKMD